MHDLTDAESQECVWAVAHVPAASHSWAMCTFDKHLDSWVSRKIQENGCFECGSLNSMLVLLQAHWHAQHTSRRDCRKNGPTSAHAISSGPLLVDVGSNIGMYALAAAASCFEAIAFEPVPINAHKMITSARLNNFSGRLHVYTVGASDAYSFFDMGFSADNQGEATHTPRIATASSSSSANPGLVAIPMAPLSSVLPRQPPDRPVFVKMDLEGGECRALRGMRAFLRRSRIAGLMVETGHALTRSCCSELMAPDLGAFSILHRRHGLCPRAHFASRAHEMEVETLCQRSAKDWPWEMVWLPCNETRLHRLMRRNQTSQRHVHVFASESQ